MKVAIANLGDHPVVLEASENPREIDLRAEGVEFDAPVAVTVKITRMQEDVLAQGEAHTVARCQCARCLEAVEVELSGRFEALYVADTGAYATRAGRRDFEWADQRVNFYTEGTIDLDEEIRQCIVLALPMKPLCRPDCAGLCPSCGKNLNNGPCGCKSEPRQDVWDQLRKVIKTDEE